jgi:hypothetical protein
MSGVVPKIHKPLYFIMVSVLSGGVYYLVLAAASGFSHAFLNLFLFPIFMAFLLIIGAVAYALSFRGIPPGDMAAHRAGVRKTAVIVLAALAISAIFPAGAFVRLYPVPMAMFHLLILFYAGLVLAAICTSWLVFYWREWKRPPFFSEPVLVTVAFLALALAYTSMRMYGLLPPG